MKNKNQLYLFICFSIMAEPLWAVLKEYQPYKLEMSEACRIVPLSMVQMDMGDTTLRMAEGEIWIAGMTQACEVQSPFGSVKIAKDSETLLTRDRMGLKVAVLTGKVTIQTFFSEPQRVEPGLASSLQDAKESASVLLNIPYPFATEEMLEKALTVDKTLGMLDQKEMKEKALSARREQVKMWGEMREKVASYHETVVKREVASVKEREQAEKTKKQKLEQERQYYRQLFRKKLFLE